MKKSTPMKILSDHTKTIINGFNTIGFHDVSFSFRTERVTYALGSTIHRKRVNPDHALILQPTKSLADSYNEYGLPYLSFGLSFYYTERDYANTPIRESGVHSQDVFKEKEDWKFQITIFENSINKKNQIFLVSQGKSDFSC